MWFREIGNYWHYLTRDHRHIARDNEEMIICYPRRWWMGQRHYLYSKDGAEWIEVTEEWLKRLANKDTSNPE